MATATLLLELGGLLLGLALAARAADRIGLSPVPLYLLVGLALGNGGVYPLVTADPFVEAGAEIGVVLLLLMLGLEFSPEELLSGLRSGVPVTAVDLLANFTPGFVAGLLFDFTFVGAVVLGGVTYISSSGIVAKLVDDLGWLANRETPVVLSLLVAEDLVMAVYLPLLAALLVGGGWLSVGVSMVVALAIAGAALVVAVRFGRGLSELIAARSNEALLLGVLGLTLLVAGAAERLNISAAVGAFLVGMAFSGPVQERARGLLRPVRDLFAASFFVFFGLGVDPGEIPPVALAALALAGITAATKYATGWWGASRLGIAGRGRRRAGTVLVARGEFSIVVAEIGIAAGLHPRLGPVSATYVLFLAIAGPVTTRLASS